METNPNLGEPVPKRHCPNSLIQANPESQSHFDRLPEELIIKIFAFTDLGNQLAAHLAPVCKKFRRLSLDPSLWTRLLFNVHADLNKAVKFVKRSTLLVKIVARSRRQVGQPPELLRLDGQGSVPSLQ